MSSIDTRVVEAKFNNQQFNSGVSDTVSSLDKLKAGLKLDGAASGIQQVSAAANSFNTSNMEDGAGRISGAFSAMQATVFGAFASIGAKFASTAMELAKGLTIGPIKGGLDDYHAKLTSVQTIMNATGANMQTVNGYFKQLDTYSDKTIYNLSDMTGAFAKFTNAGVGMDKSVPAIKGIANMVALAGQGADAAGIAMYNLSQSIAGGFLTTTDYKSLNLANVATKEWKNQMIDGAIAAGKLEKKGGDAYHIVGTKAGASATSAELFNEQLKEGWASSDVLLSVLGKYGDETTSIGKKAQAAAQDVKSFPMMMDTLKAAVGTGWTDTFEILLGNVDESKQLFTSLTNTIGGFLGKSADARNELLQGWKVLGGRTALIDGLKAGFGALFAVLKPIGEAFRSIFPKTTSSQLATLTQNFRDFMQDLMPAPATIENIRRTFAGVFAILHIGWTVVKGLAKFFFDLFAGVEEGDKGILKTTATIGDFFVNLDKAISKGGGVTKFFTTLKDLLFILINPLKNLGKLIGNAFAGVDVSGAGAALGNFVSSLLSFGNAVDDTSKKASSGADTIKAIFGGLIGIASNVAATMAKFGKSIANAFSGLNFDDVMKGLQTFDFAAVAAGLFSVTKGLKSFNIFGGKSGMSGMLGSLKDSLNGLSGTLKSMQNDNNASALLKLAGAIALLALAVMLLASIDPKALTAASIAMSILFIELTKGMALFNKAVGLTGAAKMVLLVPALIGIAIAILLLVVAVKVLTALGWEGLAKGLGSLAVMLGMLSASVRIMAENNKRMLSTGAALMMIAVAINILVAAVWLIAQMDMASLAQGLFGIAAIITGLTLFTRFAKSGAKAAAQGAGLALLAAGVFMLAKAVQEMAKLSWADMLRGLAGIGLAMGGLILALKGIGGNPKTLLAAIALTRVAASMGLVAGVFERMAQLSWSELIRGMMAFAVSFGMVILAIKAVEKVNFTQLAGLSMVTDALGQMAEALQTMGQMSTDEMVHGLIGLVGAIGVLSVALIVLSKVPAEAGMSLGIVAASLALLAPALATMAGIPIAGIVSALVLLAGVFTIIGIATKFLAPSVPILMGLAGGIALLGLAVALAGAGVLAFAVGFTMLGAAAAVGTAGIVAAFSAIIGLIPMVLEQVGLGLVALANVIATSAPAFIGAMTAILNALLQSVINVLPKLAILIMTLITLILTIIDNAVPKMIKTGINILLAFLKGIADNIGKVVDLAARIIREFLGGIARNMGSIVTKAVDVIVAFINGIRQNLPRIIQSGIDLIISFMNGIGDAARNNGAKLAEAGYNMAEGIVEGFMKGIGALAGKVKDAAVNMAKSAWNGALDFLGIHSPSRLFIQVGKYTSEGFAIGLTGNKDKIEEAAKTMGEQLASALESAHKTAVDQGKRVSDLVAKRAENLRQIQLIQADMAKVAARPIGSTSKNAATRAAEIKRETDARDKAYAADKERIRKLNIANGKLNTDIRNAQLARNEGSREEARIKAAQAELKKMGETQQKLEDLSTQRDAMDEKIKDANKVLEDATKTRDDYNKSLTDTLGKQEAVSKDTHLDDYVKNLQQQIIDTQNFTIAIQELRKRGLNDEMYKQLLDTGPSTMPFLQDLLDGGQSAIDNINYLGGELDKAAGNLGGAASSSLYQAGVDAAQGIVDGLQNQRDALNNEMEKLAEVMVNAIKNKLQIKSPSRVFAQLGSYSAEGLAQGLQASSAVVGKSAEGLGNTVLDSMKKTISGLGDLVSGDMDVNPVITPVLDLSMIQKGASGIGSLLSDQPLSVDGSLATATNASVGYEANLKAFAEAAFAQPQAPVTFIQNNNSPKALSSAEIYRQTNNQISVAKGALTSNAS